MEEIKKVTNSDLPIIGIPAWKTGDNSFGCTLAYLYYLSHFGEVKILTMTETLDESLDLLVIPGGSDVDPRRYNQVPGYYTTKPDPVKEYFDTVILPKYIEAGIPVLGVCRGAQSIAILFRAQLVQHMYHESNTELSGRDALMHEVVLKEGTSFEKAYKEVHPSKAGKSDKIKVNSMHHQCISLHEFPDELEVIAYYKGSHPTSIEAFKHRTLPIVGVQYHPEELTEDPLGDFIIEELINKSKNYQQEEVILDHGDVRSV